MIFASAYDRRLVCNTGIDYSLHKMPLFGEIVEPVSRALYIDESSEDEDTLEESSIKLWKLEWVDEAPKSVDTFLFFHGQLATDFLLKILQGIKSNSALHLKDKLLLRSSGRPSKEINIPVYKLSSNIYGCVCPSVDIAFSNRVLELLLPIFSISKQVVAVATVPAPFYKGNDPTLDLPPAFMRALFSSTFNSKHVIAPLLEPPNMISGVPASVLSWCEVFKKPGCLYVCYGDSHHLDSITAEPLINIFSNIFKGTYDTKILSFQSDVHEPSSSNLYM